MKFVSAIHVCILAFVVILLSQWGCSGLSLTDTDTGSEVENGIVASVDGHAVEVRTRANTSVALIDTGFTYFDTSHKIIQRQSDPGGVIEFQFVPSGIYNLIVSDSSANEGALLRGLAFSEDQKKSYRSELKKLSAVSGFVNVVQNDTSEKIVAGTIGLVGTPFAKALSTTGTLKVKNGSDTLHFTFTMDNIPAGTYNYAIQFRSDCPACSMVDLYTTRIHSYSVDVIPGRQLQDTVLFVKD